MIGPGRKKKPSTVNEIQVTLKLKEQPDIEGSSDFFYETRSLMWKNGQQD